MCCRCSHIHIHVTCHLCCNILIHCYAVTDYYHESLAYLSYMFDTPHFLEASHVLFEDNLSPPRPRPPPSTIATRARAAAAAQSSVLGASASSASSSTTTTVGEESPNWEDIISRNRADGAESRQRLDGKPLATTAAIFTSTQSHDRKLLLFYYNCLFYI